MLRHLAHAPPRHSNFLAALARLPQAPLVMCTRGVFSVLSIAFVLGSLTAYAEPLKKAPPRKAEKAAPAPAPAPAPMQTLAVVEVSGPSKVDYQAEVDAGVALDSAYAKERGLSGGPRAPRLREGAARGLSHRQR